MGNQENDSHILYYAIPYHRVIKTELPYRLVLEDDGISVPVFEHPLAEDISKASCVIVMAWDTSPVEELVATARRYHTPIMISEWPQQIPLDKAARILAKGFYKDMGEPKAKSLLEAWYRKKMSSEDAVPVDLEGICFLNYLQLLDDHAQGFRFEDMDLETAVKHAMGLAGIQKFTGNMNGSESRENLAEVFIRKQLQGLRKEYFGHEDTASAADDFNRLCIRNKTTPSIVPSDINVWVNVSKYGSIHAKPCRLAQHQTVPYLGEILLDVAGYLRQEVDINKEEEMEQYLVNVLQTIMEAVKAYTRNN